MKRFVSLLVLLMATGVVRADVPGVLHWDSTLDLETVYNSV